MIIHTTTSAAEYLQRRYAIKVQSRTIKQWCNRGKLSGAYRIGEGRRSIWQIPQENLDKEADRILENKPANVATNVAQPKITADTPQHNAE